MIFYFSGTGNSEWVAKEIASRTGNEAVNIIGAGGKAFRFEKGQTAGLVFPVYSWAPPEVVLKFARNIEANGAYTFVVCTYGAEAGRTVKMLNNALRLDSAWGIAMPNNYMFLSGFDVESEADVQRMLANASAQIPVISKAVAEKEIGIFDVHEGENFMAKMPIAFFFNHFGRGTKPFYVTDDCNACGLCAKMCPTKTITIADGKPRWGKKCYQCLSCINRCPQRAIEYGKRTQNKGRYVFCGPSGDGAQ